MVLGQAKSNEIPLASSINVTGCIVTMDAMHAQHERRLLERRMSSRRSEITRRPCSTTSRPSTSRARSKPSTRAHRAPPPWSTSPAPSGTAALLSTVAAIRIEREICKTKESSVETTWCLTSLGPERPEMLLARGSWKIDSATYAISPATKTAAGCAAQPLDKRRHPALRRTLHARGQPALRRPGCAPSSSRR